MWENLTRGDLERATEELKCRREDMLKRHAEEISALDDDQAGIESLDQLADDFFQRFKTAMTPLSAPAASEEKQATEAAAPHHPPHHHSRDKHAPNGQHREHREHRDYSQTNFDTFSRALSRTI